VLLVLDEIQKVRGWSETIKRLWDANVARGLPLRVVLLGSSALLVQRGITESLAGRFLLHRCQHWSLPECRAAFGWDLSQWLHFGGYPGAAPLADDEALWRQYIADSMIETVLSRDVFQLAPVTKPVLMRHLFALAATHPAQIFSYNKMLGQLLDVGNTTTLAAYLRLLDAAFLLSGLEQYSAGQLRKRGSSPKLVFWNNALINAMNGLSRAAAQSDGAWHGRIVENAVGAHLLNHLQGPEWSLAYWRDGDYEVDYVVRRGAAVWALEVKSGRTGKLFGLAAFRKRHPDARALVIGGEGLPLEDFFNHPPQELFSAP
jgi:predicted AAA+ superfamily ATPase